MKSLKILHSSFSLMGDVFPLISLPVGYHIAPPFRLITLSLSTGRFMFRTYPKILPLKMVSAMLPETLENRLYSTKLVSEK
jgi:hypothetical protein